MSDNNCLLDTLYPLKYLYLLRLTKNKIKISGDFKILDHFNLTYCFCAILDERLWDLSETKSVSLCFSLNISMNEFRKVSEDWGGLDKTMPIFKILISNEF